MVHTFLKKSGFVTLFLMLSAAAIGQSTGVHHPATDGLGRPLPTHEEVGGLRPDKLVAMFFWTWHSGHSTTGRDYDLTEIITTPDMINDYDHPNWDPYLNLPFFWAEPLFGFYDGKDPWVARKQIEMLGAAGVDALFYDATNGAFIWKEGYETVGDAMEEARADGVDVPQFAFMLNFSVQDSTAQALGELYRNMYSIGLYEDSWFRWKGKPVVMAYPEALGTPGDTAGMRFTASQPFTGINANCPSWANDIGDLTLTLYPWTGDYGDSISQTPLASETFVDYADNSKLSLTFAQLPAGDYLWELSAAWETVGVWKFQSDTPNVVSYFNGWPVTNDYRSQIQVGGNWTDLSSGSDHEPVEIAPPVVNSQPGDTLGMQFTAASAFTGVDAVCPAWGQTDNELTLSLYGWAGSYSASVAQEPLAEETFIDYSDGAKLQLEFSSQPAGNYVWELSQGKGQVGAWKWNADTAGVVSYFNGVTTTGDFMSNIKIGGTWSEITSGSDLTAVALEPSVEDKTLAEILNFFTFRPGQPTYNTGPTRNDQWGWSENYPQNGYVQTGPGEYEWMTVSIAQNWSEQTNALSAMNGPQIHGRSYTWAEQFDKLTSTSYLYGYNFQEQWDRALAVDPEIIFITGWNEWVAGRYEYWSGVENAFPDQFSPEYSRDIEPSKGFIKDHYYYQMIANIRRFKGMEPPPQASKGKVINLDGAFTDWADVWPQFTDSRGDVMVRDGYGYIDQTSPTNEYLHYTNNSARNDIVTAKVTQDGENVYFYVETAEALTAYTDPNWMFLLIDLDRDKSTGWEGYEYGVAGYQGDNTARLYTSEGSWSWTEAGTVDYRAVGSAMEVAVPYELLGLSPRRSVQLEFKWIDTPSPSGDIMEVYTDGEAAPDGRFNYHYEEYRPTQADNVWLRN